MRYRLTFYSTGRCNLIPVCSISSIELGNVKEVIVRRTLKIGEVAKLSSTTTKTIRYYELLGLLRNVIAVRTFPCTPGNRNGGQRMTSTVFLTPNETAEILRTSVRTLERTRLEGTGPRFVKFGRRVL